MLWCKEGPARRCPLRSFGCLWFFGYLLICGATIRSKTMLVQLIYGAHLKSDQCSSTSIKSRAHLNGDQVPNVSRKYGLLVWRVSSNRLSLSETRQLSLMSNGDEFSGLSSQVAITMQKIIALWSNPSTWCKTRGYQ